MSERWFKCGVCGTEARGFCSDLMLAAFADDHANACAGHASAEKRAPTTREWLDERAVVPSVVVREEQ